MEKITLDFDKVERLTNSIVQCEGVLQEQDLLIQGDFKELNEEFDDEFYKEFQAKFAEGARVVNEMRQAVDDIIVAIIDYAEKMNQAK